MLIVRSRLYHYICPINKNLMRRAVYKSYFTLLLLFLLMPPPSLLSQNLVRNCEFEIMNGCPSGHGQISMSSYWLSPGDGTTDYLHACNNGNFSVPENQFGTQAARSGNAYANIICYYSTQGSYREYIQTELGCTMQAGQRYQVSFYVSCADISRFAIDGMGAHFTPEPLKQPGTSVIELPQGPHIRNAPGHILNNKTGWVEVYGEYTAAGGEKYLTIGNFLKNDEISIESFTSWTSSLSSYFIDDVDVIAIDPLILLISDTTICPGDSITLDLGKTCDLLDLQWEDGTTNPKRTISKAGTYSYHGKSGCSEVYGQFTLSVSEAPMPLLPPDTAICPGQVIDIIPAGDYEYYEWSDGSVSPILEAQTGGLYRLTVTDAFGCIFSDSILLTGITAPQFSLGNDTIICLGHHQLLDPGIDSLFHHCLWSGGSNGTRLWVEESGEYRLIVSNLVIGTRNCNPLIHLPNAFTPDGDGRNDIFMAKGENIAEFRMFIYDRWGTLLFESNSMTDGWDGTFRGEPCPDGIYVWIVRSGGTNADEKYENSDMQGTVVLLRSAAP